MAEIDQKLKEIEDLNKRNYRVDLDFLKLYSDEFEKLDTEIVEASNIEYNESNHPSYYP
jgi:hypothetical protein